MQQFGTTFCSFYSQSIRLVYAPRGYVPDADTCLLGLKIAGPLGLQHSVNAVVHCMTIDKLILPCNARGRASLQKKHARQCEQFHVLLCVSSSAVHARVHARVHANGQNACMLTFMHTCRTQSSRVHARRWSCTRACT
jgi:hypothetical protein